MHIVFFYEIYYYRFCLLGEYATLSPETHAHCLEASLFTRLFYLFLGDKSPVQDGVSDTVPRILRKFEYFFYRYNCFWMILYMDTLWSLLKHAI